MGGRYFLGLRRKDQKKAMKLAESLLEGVGDGKTYRWTTPRGIAGHVQRALSQTEIGLLPDGWMEIPAVDERGPVFEWK